MRVRFSLPAQHLRKFEAYTAPVRGDSFCETFPFMKNQKTTLLVIVGPTASGKSALAVELAERLNGEVISADSRQVYKGLDIGTGKITKDEMKGVPHHLLDVADPNESFSVEQYKTLAQQSIRDIVSRGKLSILCGGTGFYIHAVIDNVTFPKVPPNPVLRKELESQDTASLLKRLKTFDPDRASSIDPHNKVRIIRSIEIATALGKVPSSRSHLAVQPPSRLIGLKLDDTTLRDNIIQRLHDRLEKGMIDEVKQLHSKGLSWERLESFGLEYRYISLFLQNKPLTWEPNPQVTSKEELVRVLENKIWQYSRRQMTWFKRDKRIKWFNPENRTDIIDEIDRVV